MAVFSELEDELVLLVVAAHVAARGGKIKMELHVWYVRFVIQYLVVVQRGALGETKERVEREKGEKVERGKW